MAKRLKIGVDVDGVLVDFVAAFLREAASVLGREITGVHTTWMFEDSLAISAEEVEKVWAHIKATDNWFYLNSIALPAVDLCLPWLTSQHDVYFISSRATTTGFTAERQIAMFLDEIGVSFPTVIVVKDKGPVVAALELDAFVDDRVENLERIFEASPKTACYLMEHPYNVEAIGPWIRVPSFSDFVREMEDLSGESHYTRASLTI